MSLLRPGFAAPEADAQACFRAILAAHAAPGSRHVAGAGLDPPAPLAPATAAVLLTLVDADTPLWLDVGLGEAWPWLAFHTGATPATSPAEAKFVCATTLPDLAALDQGTDESPEGGATVVLQLPSLDGGPPCVLSGPGLAVPRTLRVNLPHDFPRTWAVQRGRFPRGVDVLICRGTDVVALPRSIDVAAA